MTVRTRFERVSGTRLFVCTKVSISLLKANVVPMLIELFPSGGESVAFKNDFQSGCPDVFKNAEQLKKR
jgi:hypothetical protein